MAAPKDPAAQVAPPPFLGENDPDKSWGSFVESCLATIDRAARRSTLDGDTADDVAAEVLGRLREDWPALLRRYRDTGGDAPFRVWLAVVARRAAIDVIRARHGRTATPRAVQRLSPWMHRLWALTFREQRQLTDAAEHLRREGLWQGELSELAEALQALENTLPDRARASLRGRAPVALHGDAGESLGLATTDGDLTHGDPELHLARATAHGHLLGILEELSPEDQQLVRVYFLDGATAKGVAAATSLGSAERVYEKIKTVMRTLRAAAESRGLGPADLPALKDFDWTDALGPRGGPQ